MRKFQLIEAPESAFKAQLTAKLGPGLTTEPRFVYQEGPCYPLPEEAAQLLRNPERVNLPLELEINL